MKAAATRITYLFDPLCGWCYGAMPALERLAELDDIDVDLAPTGLFAGENARPMDTSFAAYAWQNDQRIARLTGQVFSDAYRTNILDMRQSLFDSAPATLGVVAVGITEAHHEMEALKILQKTRYIDGRDTADLAVVSDILASAGFAEAARGVASPDDALLNAYRRRIDNARKIMTRFELQGVPALMIEDDNGSRTLPSNALFVDPDSLGIRLRAA